MSADSSFLPADPSRPPADNTRNGSPWRRFASGLVLSDSARYRWSVASRALAAIGGGYVVAAMSAAALALWLPAPRVEAAMTGTLASFLVYAAAVVWVFAARSAWWAWGGLLMMSALLGAMVGWQVFA